MKKGQENHIAALYIDSLPPDVNEDIIYADRPDAQYPVGEEDADYVLFEGGKARLLQKNTPEKGNALVHNKLQLNQNLEQVLTRQTYPRIVPDANNCTDYTYDDKKEPDFDLPGRFQLPTFAGDTNDSFQGTDLKENWENLKGGKKNIKKGSKHFRSKVLEFFFGPPETCMELKTLLGFPFGALIGFVLYKLVIEGLHLSKEAREVLGGSLCLGLACGYALSIQVRCTTCLILPIFFGKSGRSYISTFAILYLISGPIQCLILNAKEVARSLSCSVELSVNHTRDRFELTKGPMDKLLGEFQREGFYLNDVVGIIEKNYEPIKKEVQTTQKGKRRADFQFFNRTHRSLSEEEEQYMKRKRAQHVESEYRAMRHDQCEDVWREAETNCRREFRRLEERCLEAIPLLGYLLCLPLKLTIACKIVRAVPSLLGMDCDAMDVVPAGFGENYVTTSDMVNDMENSFEATLMYKVAGGGEQLDYTSAEEIRQQTLKDFESKQTWVQFGLAILQRFLAFTFILVAISAYKYNKNYLIDFSFDNIYITNYFRQIDARRKAQGKKVLLPLKKSEAADVIFPTSTKLTPAEKKKLSKGTLMLVMRVFICTIIIMSDRLLYSVLDLIRRHSRIEYRQQGIHMLEIHVEGKGFMATVVRLVLLGFNSKKELDKVSTNFECLPQPVLVDPMYVTMVYTIFAVVWLFLLGEAYGLRLRRLVASFYYRKREKKRILYMYNEMLKRRRGYLRHMRHRIRRRAKRRQLTKETSLTSSLLKEFPLACGFLKKFKSSKVTCLICDEPEQNHFHHCDTPGCNFGYCSECWIDVKHRCFACCPEDENDDDLSELSDDDLSSEDEI